MSAVLHVAVTAVAELPPPDDGAWPRWLGPAELAYCAGRRRAGEHLAARAMARRAVAAALGWSGEPPSWSGEPPWRDIAVQREPSGRPYVLLSETLDRWRRRHDLPVPGVSLTHAAGYAAALAWLPGVPS